MDFGAVQDVYRNTMTRGGTFVGTLGYMPLEQFRGQVKPASDLYSLGASLLFLLTGKSPADLPQVRMKIDWRSRVNISDRFADWLDKMLEPALEERFTSAKEALNALSVSTVKGKNLPLFAFKNPPLSGMKAEIKGDRATIYIPPKGWDFTSIFTFLFLMLVIFYSVSLIFIAKWRVIGTLILSAIEDRCQSATKAIASSLASRVCIAHHTI